MTKESQTLQGKNLQEKTQTVLKAVESLLGNNEPWIYKDWFVTLLFELLAAYDPDSGAQFKHIGAPVMDPG